MRVKKDQTVFLYRRFPPDSVLSVWEPAELADRKTVRQYPDRSDDQFLSDRIAKDGNSSERQAPDISFEVRGHAGRCGRRHFLDKKRPRKVPRS